MNKAEESAIRNSTYKGKKLKDMSRWELMVAVYKYGNTLNETIEQHIKDLEKLQSNE